MAPDAEGLEAPPHHHGRDRLPLYDAAGLGHAAPHALAALSYDAAVGLVLHRAVTVAEIEAYDLVLEGGGVYHFYTPGLYAPMPMWPCSGGFLA